MNDLLEASWKDAQIRETVSLVASNVEGQVSSDVVILCLKKRPKKF
jgi:hypothetical protein